MPKVIFTIEPGLLAAFDDYCHDKNTTRSHAIRTMIAAATGLDKPKKPKHGIKSTPPASTRYEGNDA